MMQSNKNKVQQNNQIKNIRELICLLEPSQELVRSDDTRDSIGKINLRCTGCQLNEPPNDQDLILERLLFQQRTRYSQHLLSQ